jgi:hypothetical protein
MLMHLIPAMGQFGCPDHFSGSIVDDRHSTDFRAWIDFDAQGLNHGLRFDFFQDQHTWKSVQHRRLALC